MKQVALGGMPLGSSRFAGLAPRIHRVLLCLFVLQFAGVWLRVWLPRRLLPDAGWPEALLLVLATATLLMALNRQLPGQNVMLTSGVIALIGGAIHTLGAATGIPFGPFTYTSNLGCELFHPLPWVIPLVWLTLVLASRGVARLILRPWRKAKTYGFRCMGLTAGLVVLFDLGLDPYATQIKHYWTWTPTKLRLEWYTAPYTNSLGWGLTALLILACATPALINKAPGQQRGMPDYSPLIIWLLLSLLFATAAAAHHLWLACGTVSLTMAAVGALAVRGARG